MRRILTITALLMVAACSRAPEQAPDAAAGEAASREKWAKLADLPDWSGVWEIDWRNTRGAPPRPAMKLTPEYEQGLNAYRKGQERGENLQGQVANCVPPGLPGIMTQPYPIEFLYQPGKVVMLTEAFMQFRHIHTDGRAHPEDPIHRYSDSVGSWMARDWGSSPWLHTATHLPRGAAQRDAHR